MKEQKLGVTEAVLSVGYSDASHFAENSAKNTGLIRRNTKNRTMNSGYLSWTP
jgi:hypothetical protein